MLRAVAVIVVLLRGLGPASAGVPSARWTPGSRPAAPCTPRAGGRSPCTWRPRGRGHRPLGGLSRRHPAQRQHPHNQAGQLHQAPPGVPLVVAHQQIPPVIIGGSGLPDPARRSGRLRCSQSAIRNTAATPPSVAPRNAAACIMRGPPGLAPDRFWMGAADPASGGSGCPRLRGSVSTAAPSRCPPSWCRLLLRSRTRWPRSRPRRRRPPLRATSTSTWG